MWDDFPPAVVCPANHGGNGQRSPHPPVSSLPTETLRHLKEELLKWKTPQQHFIIAQNKHWQWLWVHKDWCILFSPSRKLIKCIHLKSWRMMTQKLFWWRETVLRDLGVRANPKGKINRRGCKIITNKQTKQLLGEISDSLTAKLFTMFTRQSDVRYISRLIVGNTECTT